MDTPIPTQPAMAAATPRTDIVQRNLLQIFKQWKDGHIYDSDVEGFFFGAFSDCASLESELAALRAELASAKASEYAMQVLFERVADKLDISTVTAVDRGHSEMLSDILDVIDTTEKQLAQLRADLAAKGGESQLYATAFQQASELIKQVVCLANINPETRKMLIIAHGHILSALSANTANKGENSASDHKDDFRSYDNDEGDK